MSVHATKLKDAASGDELDAELHDELTLDDLFDAEEQWTTTRIGIRRKLKHARATRDVIPESLHWDWSKKALQLRPERLSALGDARLFGIRLNEWQGVLLAETASNGAEHRARLGRPGRPMVYVPLVEVAPWNWDVPPPGNEDARSIQQRRFKGLGFQLIECAIRWSKQLEFHGRIGLHSLPQAEDFYRYCGMTDLGPDLQTKHQMHYFEATEEQATRFLEGNP